jgi:hypothetical protein
MRGVSFSPPPNTTSRQKEYKSGNQLAHSQTPSYLPQRQTGLIPKLYRQYAMLEKDLQTTKKFKLYPTVPKLSLGLCPKPNQATPY